MRNKIVCFPWQGVGGLNEQDVVVCVALSFLVTIILFSCPTPVQADSISDSFTVYSPTGVVVASVSVSESTEDPTVIYSISDTSLVDPAQFGNATVLVHPDGTQSDIFGIAGVSGGLELSFSSDSETTGLNFGTFPRTLPEGGGVFDATLYLNPALRTAGYTAQFVSQVEAPEPASGALLASGLLLVIAAGLFRKRKTLVAV